MKRHILLKNCFHNFHIWLRIFPNDLYLSFELFKILPRVMSAEYSKVTHQSSGSSSNTSKIIKENVLILSVDQIFKLFGCLESWFAEHVKFLVNHWFVDCVSESLSFERLSDFFERDRSIKRLNIQQTSASDTSELINIMIIWRIRTDCNFLSFKIGKFKFYFKVTISLVYKAIDHKNILNICPKSWSDCSKLSLILWRIFDYKLTRRFSFNI